MGRCRALESQVLVGWKEVLVSIAEGAGAAWIVLENDCEVGGVACVN